MQHQSSGVSPEEYFSRTADDYDQWYNTKVGCFIDWLETELAFRMLPPQGGWRVLDAGCGTGNFTFKLARYGCSVTGVDISPDMLQRAQQKLRSLGPEGSPVEFRQMDINRLAFCDAAFDAVYSMSAFEFIDDRRRAFDELWRVVKPGGKILIGTIAANSSWGRAYRRKAESDPESVFNYACFASREDYENIYPRHVVDSDECLFIPADAPPGEFNRAREKEYSDSTTGGFFCVLWEKPA